jgi:uncharacterized protein
VVGRARREDGCAGPVTIALPILNCDGCGVCCHDLGSPPFVGAEVFNLPPRLRRWLLAKLATIADPRGRPCVAFNALTRRCRIYRWRPAICRDMPVGGKMCREYRRGKIQ